MKLDWIIENWANQAYFDLQSLVRLSGERRTSVLKQLHRWSLSGKIIRLKRGVYTLSQKYQKQNLSAAKLANIIYSPSYLSSVWVLGYYGLIPEKVAMFSNVTMRTTRKFENAVGVFQYQHVQKKLFFGYSEFEMDGQLCLMAKPEKALLDFLYLTSGNWSENRLQELRLQNLNILKTHCLLEWSPKYPQRVQKAVALIQKALEDTDEGIEL